VGLRTPPRIYINAGGRATGNFVVDDGYFSGTSTTYVTAGFATLIDTSKATNPAPEAVYRSARQGKDFTYTVNNLTPNQPYTVSLDFAELFYQAAGKRQFNVTINGAQVLTNFDIFAAAGDVNTAVRKVIQTVADSNGVIHIQFHATQIRLPSLATTPPSRLRRLATQPRTCSGRSAPTPARASTTSPATRRQRPRP
jgi:hypothetical protein